MSLLSFGYPCVLIMADIPSNPAGSINEITSNGAGAHAGTVQVQVIPTQTGINTTGSSSSILSNSGSLLTTTGSNQDAQLSQLGLRFPVDQQKYLLAAQLQQLSKNSSNVNTSFVIQPTFQVMSSSPSHTTTKG